MKNPTTFIYALTDPRTELIFYVGKADNPWDRLWGHLKERGVNPRKYSRLRILEKEGLIPGVVILAETPKDIWAKAEVKWIAYCRARGLDLLNLTDGGEGFSGSHSEETRRRISEAHRGKKHLKEAIRKTAEANRGKKHSDERRQKNSEVHKGKKHSEETKRKIGKAGKGRRHSEKTRQKIAEALRGNKSNKGRKLKPLSEKHKLKISKALKGRKFSKETKDRMAESARCRWAKEGTLTLRKE